jgi:predicted AAA+ superfamily ATPase
MDRHIYQVLLRLNPWIADLRKWPEITRKFVPEPYVPRLKTPSLKPGLVTLLMGPRQSGKSTLVWRILSEQSFPCLYINCEEPSLRELTGSPALFLDSMDEVAPDAACFFFDEIQHMEEAGLFLKGLSDLKAGKPIVATGSSSFHLRAKTRESLAGRAERHLILPFGFEEVRPIHRAPAVQASQEQHIWEELLVWGGYPEAYLSSEKKVVLNRLLEAFILRDASDLYHIKNPGAFRGLLNLAASQIGDLANFSNLAEITGLSVNTVGQYLSILEESHIIRLVRPYVGGKRAEITSRPKIYFMDNGLRNALFGGFSALHERPDMGKLLENFTFTELCKYTNPLLDAIHFWRSSSQAEVDFVVIREGRMVAVEVKASRMKKPKVSRSLRSFIEAYRPHRVLVVNTGLEQSLMIGETPVHFVLGHQLINWL